MFDTEFTRYPLFRMTCHAQLAERSMVGVTGIEPVTSSLSGMRSNRLSYTPAFKNGGGKRDRTDDLLNANQALSQLSYTPRLVLLFRE